MMFQTRPSHEGLVFLSAVKGFSEAEIPRENESNHGPSGILVSVNSEQSAPIDLGSNGDWHAVGGDIVRGGTRLTNWGSRLFLPSICE